MMQELTDKIQQWAVDRGINTAEPHKQMLKLIEEIGEIAAGLARGNTNEVIDGIGDVKVVTTILKEQLKNESDSNMPYQNLILLLLLHDVGALAREIVLKHGVALIKDVEQVERGLAAFAKTMDTSVEDCTAIAWNEIKDRKGQMVNGVFVKEEDLP